MVLLIFAQVEPPVGAPWWGVLVENTLALTILFIFLSAIIGAVVRMRQKDKCLKLIDDHHVSVITADGQVMWGDLDVFSQGLELRFDAPYRDADGLIKTSALMYAADMANCLAICRTAEGLTEHEQKKRKAQIRSSFNPGLLLRIRRWVSNFFNTLRDAVNKAFGAVLGQVSRTAVPTSVLGKHRGSMEQIGQTLMGTIGNAYEPMLERHIGRSVLLQLASPADPEKKRMELPGYLVDYSDKFLAVFNVEHESAKTQHLELTESREGEGYVVTLDSQHLNITCRGPEVVIVKSVETGGRRFDLHVVLTNGTALRLPRGGDQPVRLSLTRSRQIDIVCPRSFAVVRFGSEGPLMDAAEPCGVAPEQVMEEPESAN